MAKEKKTIKRGIIGIKISNIDNHVQIEIEDNGGGIPPTHIDKIFEPYYSTKEEGHGIGLYMAKLIIEDKIGGVIGVSNTLSGAKFTIKLELSNENFSS
jgi:signal transduction histidine kinase